MTAHTLPIPDDISTINLTDPRTYEVNDLSEYWRQLRTTRPLYWHPPVGDAPGFWVVSRYADVMALYKDNKKLTSEKGNVLVTLLAGGDSAAYKMLAVTDGAMHRGLRNVLLKSFSPQALKPIVDQIRVNTTRLVVDAARRGECDFAAGVAEQIPLNTISDLLGVPTADREFLLKLNKSALSSRTPTSRPPMRGSPVTRSCCTSASWSPSAARSRPRTSSAFSPTAPWTANR